MGKTFLTLYLVLLSLVTLLCYYQQNQLGKAVLIMTGNEATTTQTVSEQTSLITQLKEQIMALEEARKNTENELSKINQAELRLSQVEGRVIALNNLSAVIATTVVRSHKDLVEKVAKEYEEEAKKAQEEAKKAESAVPSGPEYPETEDAPPNVEDQD